MAGCACLLRPTGKFVKLFYVFHSFENTQDFYPTCHTAFFAFDDWAVIPPVQKPPLGTNFHNRGGNPAAFIRFFTIITYPATIS